MKLKPTEKKSMRDAPNMPHVVCMPMDGNCLFHALGYPRVDHRVVRRAIVRHMQTHWNDYRPFATDPNYVTRMAREGEWGDELVLRAYHDLTGHPVRVVDADTGERISAYGTKERGARWLLFARGHYDVFTK